MQEGTSLMVVGLNPFYNEISVKVNLYDLLVVESAHFFPLCIVGSINVSHVY